MRDLEIPREHVQALHQELEQLRHHASELLSRIEEPELLLLKGHLLIEELLFSLLSHKMRKPSSIERARLSFSQAISLVEGLYHGEDLNQSWLYTACHQLNKVRNRLAHNAKPDGIDREITHFIAFVMANNSPTQAPINPLRYALGSIHASFSVLLTLHKKVALVPVALHGLPFKVLITMSKVLVRNDAPDA